MVSAWSLWQSPSTVAAGAATFALADVLAFEILAGGANEPTASEEALFGGGGPPGGEMSASALATLAFWFLIWQREPS